MGLVLAAAIALGGCMIGPDFVAPSAPIAEKWADAEDAHVDTSRQEYRNWWKVFDDPILETLIETAYQQNLTLQMAGVRVLQARATLGLAIGDLYPQQQGIAAQVDYNRLPFTIPYDIIKTNFWQTLIGAQAGWEIDLWGKIRRGIESADYAYLASVAEYDDVLVTLTGDVASAYVDIRTIEARIKIAQENIAKQTEAVKIAENRFRGGVVSKRDVYQAETELGETQASIPELTIELQKAKNGLSVLLGMPPGQLDGMLAGKATIPTVPAQVAVGIPAELLRRRPDVRQAELEAAARCAQIGVAKADLLPAFSLVGSVGTLATDISKHDLSDVFTGKTLTYSVGPSVQWSILNYGQISNNVRVQDAKFQELLIDYQNTVLKAQEDVENGIALFGESRTQADYLRFSAKAAENALRIAMNQYKQGIADFTTVLVAEQNLFKAQNNLAVAEGNIPLGLIATYRALGGGWQLREGHEFVPPEIRDEMSERTDWGTLLTPELLEPQAPGLPSPEDKGPLIRPPEW